MSSSKMNSYNRCGNFRKNLYKLWQANKYCDIILVSGDGKTRIRAHRLVLEANTSYFSKIADEIQEVYIDAIDGVTLKILVDVCYSGTLIVDVAHMSSVYMGATHLQFYDLLIALDNHFIAQLNDSNCLHFHRIAETLSRSLLFDAAQKYICEHFKEVSNTASFLQLDAIYLNKLLVLEELKSVSAEYVFLRIIKWMQYDPTRAREDALTKLLPYLRLLCMSPQFLVEHVNPYCNTNIAHNMFIAALETKLLTIPTLISNLDCHPLSIELESERLLVVVGNETNEKHEIMEYSFEKSQWNTLIVLPIKIWQFNIVHTIASNSLCFVGTALNNSGKNDFLLWDLQMQKFTKLANVIVPRSYAIVAAFDGGGDADGGPNIIDEGWTAVKRLRSNGKRSLSNLHKSKSFQNITNCAYGACLIIVGNLMYCIGGCNVWGNLNTVECYDLARNHWSTLAPMHNARGFCGVLNDGRNLYVIGGESNVIECYSPEDNEWTEVCTVEHSAEIKACIRHNKRFVAFGNYTVLISDGDWKEWKRSDDIKCLGKFIYGAFSVPPE